jgi:hypothetical protein
LRSLVGWSRSPRFCISSGGRIVAFGRRRGWPAPAASFIFAASNWRLTFCEAVEGGGMEEVEAVSNLRAATAVFSFDEKTRWTTDGRAIFNLNPAEAIQYYQANLELVAQEAAGR